MSTEHITDVHSNEHVAAWDGTLFSQREETNMQ